ncbi:MAG TPA: translocation/assembly module TamB domain-containing protein [Terriglobales bacterium]|nr:translocation/assembly module TamB domain-containing protein [Terriglobales bacterium]
MVHARLVAALETITGGRVELGKFNVVPFRFRVEARDLTIHGTEASGEIPYAHVDHLLAEIKIISIFERQYGFSTLALDRPVVHIIVYPDGSTNQPRPVLASTEKSSIQELFSLSISRLAVVNGALLWDNQKIPLDFVADDVSGGLSYSFLHRTYEGSFRLGTLDTRLRDLHPFVSNLQAQFVLNKGYATVSSLDWSSAHSRLHAAGRVDNFSQPTLTGTYNGQLDLTELADAERVRDLRTGVLKFSGEGRWSASDFSLGGQAALSDFGWRDNSVAIRGAGASGHYLITPTAIKISTLELGMFGGSGSGALEIANWNSTANATKARVIQAPRGVLSLQLKNVSVAAATSAVSSKRLSLARLPISSTMAGNLRATWVGSPQRAELRFDLLMSPAEHGTGIPLAGHAAGVYYGSADRLELADLNLSSRASQLRAVGTLSSSSTVRFTITTSDLREWQPVLANFGTNRLPIALSGHASFDGVVKGRPSEFAIAGHLQISNFDTVLPASANLPERQFHWDTLSADVRLSPLEFSARNGSLVRGPTVIRFDTAAALRDAQWTDADPFTARLQVSKLELRELQTLAGLDYPLDGTATISLSLSGTRSEPHGEGHLQILTGSLYGQAINNFNSDLRLSAGEIQLNNAAMIYNGGSISGSAAYQPSTRAFRLNVTGNNFDLERFSGLRRGKTSMDGQLNFTAGGEGTLDKPVINANVQLRNLSFDNEPVGNFTFEAVTRGADMQLTGRSNFQQAQLAIDGTIHLRNDWPANLSLHFDHFDVDSLLRPYLGEHISGHVPAAGALWLSGPLRNARELNATADLTSFAINLDNFAIHNEGPIHFSVANQVLALDRLRLVGDGTDISARGTVQLTDGHAVDLRSDGRLNLKVLESLGPDLSASGLASVGVSVAGTYSSPSVTGKLQVTDASLSSANLPNGLSGMNGTLMFNQDRLQIETLNAKVGGGNVRLTGFMTFSPALTFDIAAEAQDVRLRPAGLSATSNADLRLVGSRRESLLSGDVTVLKLNLTPGFDFARYLEGFKQTTALPETSTLLNNVRMDIHVVTTPELQMETASAKVSGDADLRLRGTLARPLLLGRVDIMEGDVYFAGTKYRLDRGEITFTGPTGIKPTLDLEATTHVREYDITLSINGSPDNLHVNYRSEPPLPPPDIVALLSVGRTEGETATLGGSSQSLSQQASTAILSQALNATLSSRSQRLFGISRIKVDPQGLNTETTPTRTAPAVTVEQQVSSNLTLTYSTEVGQASQQIIQAEYNVTRNISILAVRDQNGVVSFDFRLRQRRK